ncbi:hypothetical protein SPRG_00041 [Saprolegnia parasitica CBS 223.65]|uniref:TRP C-terminal domain-containing protein n=1 Tax=Saprolegnia parasitica (strain CBS 223.65) TaxID=695850 RepID=A0A067D150_SAPPC|nr:hypothetical protein SPRG_00041 [Saprolegnia parasitica CBS 223.65]KDO35195.1 hypothetical protein SPRG_00041 [Saprolegnia parasitica CBS 223.65]|eukprot:XP_012193547.1 hypothetical protein SPRG_00041 [Saprolegnia parasitica CBS 223.65]
MQLVRVLAGLGLLASAADSATTCRFALNVSPAGLKLLGGDRNGTTPANSTLVLPSVSVAPGQKDTTPTPVPTQKDNKSKAPETTAPGLRKLQIKPVEADATTTTAPTVPTTIAMTSAPTPIPTDKKTTEPTVAPTDPLTKSPTPTTVKPSSGSGSGKTPTTTTSLPPGVTATPTPTPTPSNSTNVINVPAPTVATTFDIIPCDATFYKFWKTKGLSCGGVDLDVTKAMEQACSVYSGAITIGAAGFPACFSSCFIPGCESNKWDYEAMDGLSSSIYAGVNFLEAASLAKASTSATASLFPTLATKFKTSFSCTTYDVCQCPAANLGGAGNNSTSSTTGSQKRFDTWSDGTKKTTLDYVGTVTSSVSATVTYTAIATTTTMMIASSVGAVGSSASAAAAGISTGGSVGMASATMDIAQFAVCMSQLSLPGASKPLRAVGEQMSFSVFNWFTFGNVPTTTAAMAANRRLVEAYTGQRSDETGGMFQYTTRLGIRPEMLFYVTLAGIASVIGGIVILLALVLVLGPLCVKDKQAFMSNCYDRAIGLIMLVTIISQYALGVVCMFQLCLCLKSKTSVFSKELVFAILTLLVLAVGIMGYGVYDIGTAQHLEKTVHKRFGCLYDEYDFANRFFFTAKMGLALLSGMIAGTFAVSGQAQLVMLIVLHVGFFLLLSVRRPHFAPFVQNTTVIITVVKVITFGLSFLLLKVATVGADEKITNAISYGILALQLGVLLCLLARQIYIFYKTHQLKKELAASNDTMRGEDLYALDAITAPGAYAMATNSTNHRDTSQKQREWTSESHRASDDKPRFPQKTSNHNNNGKLKNLSNNNNNQPHNGQWKEDDYDPREYAI